MNMKQLVYLMSIMVFGLISCSRVEIPINDQVQSVPDEAATKALGDKCPMVSVYVETNDVNPLNAGDYMLDDGTAFFDVAELFASNINRDRNGNPTLFLNDKLANILENSGADTFYCHFRNGVDSLFSCHFERSAQHVAEKSA